VTCGYAEPDRRPPLDADVITRASATVTAELLRRFGALAPIEDLVVDGALSQVMVPFNERTASRSAVALPRGSTIRVPREKKARLFVHWCQPEKGYTTDVDLSVGFYDADWREVGVCSYYSLELVRGAETIATSGGDRQDAPFPDGASELIDLDREKALAHGIRYAVMVVNAYSGMPFSLLERAFAGLMLRDDLRGAHFDPRTVELRFDLDGENGAYLPLVLDLREGLLHWLDIYAPGTMAFNNVGTSRRSITTMCPTLIRYFGSGARPNVLELGLLHGAARARRVTLRGPDVVRFERAPGETAAAFHARLQGGRGGERIAAPPAASSTVALLYRGDLDLPAEATRYVLFPERIASTISASDLIR
jgi:hypothetical protein